MTRSALFAAALTALSATGAVANNGNQSEVPFQIQRGTSALQTAESIRGQASVATQKVKTASK